MPIDASSSHDPLTGLLSRSSLLARASSECDRARRASQKMAAIALDLHGFSHLNDVYGSEAGDEILRVVAERLTSRFRSYDVVARNGGDDFAMLAIDIQPDHVDVIVSRLLEALAEPIRLGSEDIQVSCSVGVAYDDGVSRGPELVRQADAALARARLAGPGSVIAFDPHLHEALRAKREMIADLRRDINGRRIDVEYQLLFDATGTVPRGAEALARWTRQGHGPVSPGVFIPLAEDIGAIKDLGEHVLRRACEDAAAWGDLKISVNVSPTQLLSPEFPARVAEILAETGFDASRLELELTETVFAKPEAVAGPVRELRNLGISVAIDDFGAGYSNLRLFNELRVDRIKIDRSFMAQGEWDIVQFVLQLAKSKGLETTAEGVETEIQRRTLEEAGVDMLQGFLLARPAKREVVEAMIADLQDQNRPGL